VVIYAKRRREEGLKRGHLAHQLAERGYGRFAERAIDIAITLGWLETQPIEASASQSTSASRTHDPEDFLVSTHRMFADLATD
jgi:hypothetical protein